MFENNEIQSLYRYASCLVDEPQDALDLVQTTMEICIRQAHPPHNKMQYAKTVLRNRFIDLYRKSTRWQHSDETLEDAIPINEDTRSLEQIVIDEAELDALWQRLNNEEREILFLWAVEEYSVQEIADLWQVPKGTLLSKLYRLKQKLRSQSPSFTEGSLR